MNVEELRQTLDGEQKAATFIAENFTHIELIGSGNLSKVFKARSTRFTPPQTFYAVRVLLSIHCLTEAEV